VIKMSFFIEIDGWRSNIRFSSAHIIPEYEKCGRLHGHTYAVHVKVSGLPDKKGIILDFSILKDILREIVSDLDHRILIPEKNNAVNIIKEKNSVRVSALGKDYIFPLDDCVFLPINSTSAENLAAYILERILNKVTLPDNVKNIEIGVDEGYGQGARVTKKF
jgi:6-pyruvoyltetrahydropterin/6-carboxytetrahydropterin synthase